jgi:hypothetical protein
MIVRCSTQSFWTVCLFLQLSWCVLLRARVVRADRVQSAIIIMSSTL